MGILERVISMKQEGLTDNQISGSLMDEGISPLEVNDALSQAKIKSIVSQESQDSASNSEEMQPSIMQNQDGTLPIRSEAPSSQPVQEIQEQPQYAQEQQYGQEQYSQYPQEQQQYGYNQDYYSQGTDLETIREISKREIESALSKLRQQIETFSRAVIEMKSQVNNSVSRINKIETAMSELQSAIIRKMGEYGEAISSISGDIQATQDSFSKMVNPILDHKRKMSNEDSEKTQVRETRQSEHNDKHKKGKSITTKSKVKPTFEDYLR